MSTSFSIAFYTRNGNLHVQPQGDFDGASAWEMLNLLHDQYRGHRAPTLGDWRKSEHLDMGTRLRVTESTFSRIETLPVHLATLVLY